MTYDYIIVGAGVFGSTFANLCKENRKSCLILESRNHIAGNAYTENIEGINVHKYGPHIFHTSNKKIFDFVNKFCEFNNFTYRPRVIFKNNLYSFPINLLTLYQLWGCKTPIEAQKKLESVRINIKNPKNIEEYALSQVGEEIYRTFIYGYTKKQWNTEPKDLPSEILKRIPIRLNFNDCYYNDLYQGIPIGGYTKLFGNMIENIPIELNVNFLNDIDYWCKRGKKVIYTGAIDELLEYKLGELNYRSLRFETEILNISDYQGVAAINYTEESIPYTRILEHKHFEFLENDKTVITKEYPQTWNRSLEKYYPINNDINNELYKKYEKLANSEFKNFIFGGRLATYKYYDMHQVIGQAMSKFDNESKSV